MADELEARRVRVDPAQQKQLAFRALDQGKQIATYRDTRWYKLGEEIVEVTRRSIPRSQGYSPGKWAAKVVAAVPKYARMFSNIAGPPKPPSITKRKAGGRAEHRLTGPG